MLFEMQQASSSSARRIALLEQREVQRMLEILMAGTASAQQLVDQLGLSMNRVHYLLRRLLTEDMVKVQHIEKRGGRSVKYYAATSVSFVVPFVEAAEEEAESLLFGNVRAFFDAFTRRLIRHHGQRSNQWGVTALLDEKGSLTLRYGVLKSSNEIEGGQLNKEERVFGAFFVTYLSDHEYSHLIKQLHALEQEYNFRPSHGRTPRLVGMMLLEGDL